METRRKTISVFAVVKAVAPMQTQRRDGSQATVSQRSHAVKQDRLGHGCNPKPMLWGKCVLWSCGIISGGK